MTLLPPQLVQLQRDLQVIEAAGIRVVGVSYDDVAVLKAFSDKAKIGFPLLSDPGSTVIEAYHIRNPAGRGKLDGVPMPGTFLVDRDGVIRAKLFLEGFKERHSTEALIRVAKALP